MSLSAQVVGIPSLPSGASLADLLVRRSDFVQVVGDPEKARASDLVRSIAFAQDEQWQQTRREAAGALLHHQLLRDANGDFRRVAILDKLGEAVSRNNWFDLPAELESCFRDSPTRLLPSKEIDRLALAHVITEQAQDTAFAGILKIRGLMACGAVVADCFDHLDRLTARATPSTARAILVQIDHEIALACDRLSSIVNQSASNDSGDGAIQRLCASPLGLFCRAFVLRSATDELRRVLTAINNLPTAEFSVADMSARNVPLLDQAGSSLGEFVHTLCGQYRAEAKRDVNPFTAASLDASSQEALKRALRWFRETTLVDARQSTTSPRIEITVQQIDEDRDRFSAFAQACAALSGHEVFAARDVRGTLVDYVIAAPLGASVTVKLPLLPTDAALSGYGSDRKIWGSDCTAARLTGRSRMARLLQDIGLSTPSKLFDGVPGIVDLRRPEPSHTWSSIMTEPGFAIDARTSTITVPYAGEFMEETRFWGLYRGLAGIKFGNGSPDSRGIARRIILAPAPLSESAVVDHILSFPQAPKVLHYSEIHRTKQESSDPDLALWTHGIVMLEKGSEEVEAPLLRSLRSKFGRCLAVGFTRRLDSWSEADEFSRGLLD